MDVDQTVPIENTSLDDANASSVQQNPAKSGRENLKEVTECVSELRKVEESLVSHLHTALADEANATVESQNNHSNVRPILLSSFF